MRKRKHPHINDFIPVLEGAGLIVRADLHLFERVCAFQRQCLDEGLPTVPISVNVSRIDIASGDYVGRLEDIRKRYDIPTRLLRVGITESSAIGGLELVTSTMEREHQRGGDRPRRSMGKLRRGKQGVLHPQDR